MTSPAPSAAIRGHRTRAVVASTVGTTVEWYDFFLYGTAAALVFPQIFFPGQSPYAGVIASFGTQFVGFAARPIGAAIFGHYGDRIGRKATLVTTLLVMGICTALIGVLPTYAAAGLWIAWPKRASRVPTDMTEDVVREIALPTGLVDNKVCAIDQTWSGLRLVIRRELR